MIGLFVRIVPRPGCALEVLGEAEDTLTALADELKGTAPEGWPRLADDRRGLLLAYGFENRESRSRFIAHADWRAVKAVCYVEHQAIGDELL